MTDNQTDNQEILKKIETLFVKAPEGRSGARVGAIARALLKIEGRPTGEITNEKCVAETIKPRAVHLNAVTYVRLLGTWPHELYNLLSLEQENDLLALIKARLGRVYRRAQIPKHADVTEKLRCLESAYSDVEKGLEEKIEDLNSLGDTKQWAGKLEGFLEQNNKLIKRFLPEFFFEGFISDLSSSVEGYLDSQLLGKLRTRQSITTLIDKLQMRCKLNKEYKAARDLSKALNQLERFLESDFQALGLDNPGRLTCEPIERKYPFGEPGSSFGLLINLENVGEGAALKVLLTITADPPLMVKQTAYQFEEVESGSRISPIRIPAEISQEHRKKILILCELRWTNGDGTEEEDLQELEFEPQSQEIDWESLKNDNPYSQKPIREEQDLKGRRSQLKTLKNGIRVQTGEVDSFVVKGQKRVGKTSLVRVLTNSDELKDTVHFIYLERGRYQGVGIEETVNNLGKQICKRLLKMVGPSVASRVSTPEFDGALHPLIDFLEEVLEKDSKSIVIILDDFDDLPYNLWGGGEAYAQPFFATLRTLSLEYRVGAILVGGERMEQVEHEQAMNMNLFRPVEVGYLDRNNHYQDFVDLVKQPLDKYGVDIEEAAIERIYRATAGNPYYSKIVCAALSEDVSERRDAHIGVPEVDAITSKLVEQELSEPSFAHFWEDGCKEIEKEETIFRRKTILTAVAHVLQNDPHNLTDQNILKASADLLLDLTPQQLSEELRNFEERKILTKTPSGEVSFRVGLFRDWLAEKGLLKLYPSPSDPAAERRLAQLERKDSLRVTDYSLRNLIKAWDASYKGRTIRLSWLKEWLEQFEKGQEQKAMFNLLENIQFFGGEAMENAFRDGHRKIRSRFDWEGEPQGKKYNNNVLVTWFGSDGHGGNTAATKYREANQLYRDRQNGPTKIARKIKDLASKEGGGEKVKALVFADDFVGTGKTLTSHLTEILTPELSSLLKQHEIDVFVSLVAGFSSVLETAEKTVKDNTGVPIDIVVGHELGDADRCFSEKSTIWHLENERIHAKGIAEARGTELVGRRDNLGYGNCQALVVFEQTCPNNTLPILWADGSHQKKWRPLFRRPG